jgi:outer membrane protein
MPPVRSLFLSLIALFLAWGQTAFAAVDLKAAFQAASQKAESLEIEKARTGAVEEQQNQARGALFPQIGLNGRYTRQDVPAAAAGATAAFTRADQYSVSVGATQALFRGFAEFAELRRRKALLQSQQAAENRERLTLYREVAERFYGALAADRDLANLKSLEALTGKRLGEIRQRVRIGRSRQGELLASQSQAAVLEAQIQAAENERVRARESLRLATLLPADSELAEPKGALPSDAAPLESWLAKVGTRPDLSALELQRQAADEGVSVAKGGHYPSLDAGANYYLTRTGVLANSKWDFTVTLSVPIFQGGAIQSQVEEAVQLRKISDLSLAFARREAESEVRTLYQRLVSELDQLKTLKRASELAEQNYRAQNADYRLGLVTNLEVIQSLNSLQETKRVHDRTYFDAWATLAALEAASGKAQL